MRDQYAGDVSDYLKYAFLRALVPADARLGVAWYFLPGDDGRPDGRHDEYLQDIRWCALDPELFDQLKGREHRSVAAVEKLGFWPTQTTFHAEPVPPGRARETWASEMRASLSEAEVVFLDPDNGVSGEGVVSPKSATEAEVRAFFDTGRLGLLIRFPHRMTKHPVQLETYHRAFASMAPVTIRTCARVPNANGGSSPRIRWFTALNASAEVRARMAEFAARVEALPGGSATVWPLDALADETEASTKADPPKSLIDLLSYVGMLLLKWGQIEHAMRGVVGSSGGLTAASRQGKALVEAWREIAEAGASEDIRRRSEISRAAKELEALRPLRNLVCHGIQSANSEPFAGRAPGLHCWLEDEETLVSWDDLDQAIRRLEGVAHIIR